MKYRLFVGVFLSLAIVSGGIAPFLANAQNYADGTVVSQEEYYRWLQSHDSTLRQRVNQLDENPVVNLPMPILFGVAPSDLSPNFGDPRSGGRTHEGEDIMAPRDALIVSPTAAVVLSTGVWAGAGNQVSTANPGGEIFVYMHLDKPSDLKTGDVLKAGDLIGYVGNTGNAAGGPTHLHFEIRKNNTATDPFPRLKDEFSLAQKIKFTQNIIDDSKDPDTLAQFLVANYRSQFLAAQAVGINVPSEITAEMKRVPATGAANIASFSSDLTLGSSGSTVVALQNFLITQNTGPAARALASAGATGNFGSITRSALIEYQDAVGITPADGYYGPLTRAYVQQTKPATPATSSALVPTRDLKLGSSGTDVIWLQTFLIATHSGPASDALSKAGSTGYFGAITKAALVEYQAKSGISPASGYFGPVTLAYMIARLKTV